MVVRHQNPPSSHSAMKNTPEAVVHEFWRLMASNDGNSVKRVLSDEFVMEWPQSKERILGADNFADMNNEYPTTSHWSFRINRLVAHGNEVVTQVVTSADISGLRKPDVPRTFRGFLRTPPDQGWDEAQTR